MALKKTGDDRPTAPAEEPRELISLLSDLVYGDTQERRVAALDLARHPTAVSALCRQLHMEDQGSVREALCTALGRIGGPLAVEGLIPLLRSDDAALRNDVIEVLKQLPEDLAPHIERLLRDEDADLRIFTVNVLESLKHPEVEHWLLSVVSTDPHVNVVAAALDLLGEVGTERCLPALASVRLRFGEDPFIAFAAQTAERRIRYL